MMNVTSQGALARKYQTKEEKLGKKLGVNRKKSVYPNDYTREIYVPSYCN